MGRSVRGAVRVAAALGWVTLPAVATAQVPWEPRPAKVGDNSNSAARVAPPELPWEPGAGGGVQTAAAPSAVFPPVTVPPVASGELLRSEVAGATVPPTSFRPGSAGPYGVAADSPTDLLTAPPVLDRPGQGPGWFAAADVGLVHPHVKNQLSSGTALGPAFPGPVQPPFAALDWTVSPRFELGYRLGGGAGDLRLGYRFLDTSGSDGGPLAVRSRLALNSVDFDYVSNEWLVDNPLGPFRDLRLAFGARLATAFFDTAANGGPVVGERATSRFVGAGPKVGLEWRKPCLTAPVEFYFRADAAGLAGHTQQSFAQGVSDGAGGVLGAARRDASQANGAAVVGAEAGAGWWPGSDGRTHVVAGYQFQQWWNAARTDTANADVTINGAFVRAEWRY